MIGRRTVAAGLATLLCLSGCAQSEAGSATTAASAGYVGIHWTAIEVTVPGSTMSIAAAHPAAVDFLPTGTVVFDDTVNAISGQWTTGPGTVVHLGSMATTAVGYVGTDAQRIAEIKAVQLLTSPPGDPDPNSTDATSDIDLASAPGRLTLRGNGAAITFADAGKTPPEMTRSAPATTPIGTVLPAPPSATDSTLANPVPTTG